jgi:nitronate monooxygenase
VPGCASSTEMVRQLADDFGSSVAVRCPSSSTRPCSIRTSPRSRSIDADGDSTVRTHVPDIVRSLPWPKEFTARVQRNRFVERWHGHDSELAQQAAVEAPRYLQAFADGDPDDTAVWFGEAAGLIGSVSSVASIIDQMVETASRLVSG